MFKKFVMLMCILVTLASSAGAENLTVPGELISYGEEIYREARTYHGRSFSGYCGTYVRCQLRAMGIFDNKFDFRGNGNQWYSNFENVQMTSGGYYVYREDGADCLAEIAERYGNDLENIVLSFPVQSGYSEANPGAGHALVLYKLQDGVAYYSESFSFGNNREGQVIAENAQDLVERYSRRHGSPIGCVLLSENPLVSYGSILELTDDLYEINPILAQVGRSLENIGDVTFIAKKFAKMPTESLMA